MAHTHQDFELRRTGEEHAVYWQHRRVASVKSYHQLKNAFGGCCFIVGSGPSLTDLDIGRIARFDAITLNGAILKYTQAGLAPRHHHMAHRTVFRRHLDYARAGLECGAQCFFPYLGISNLCETEPSLLSRPNLYLYESIDKQHDRPRLSAQQFYDTYSEVPGIYLSSAYRDRRGTIGFNYQTDHGFFTSNTVSVSALQIAFYLGYSTIFLLGMEFGATGKSYFYNHTPEADNDLMKNYDPDIKVCFELARQAALDHAVKIYNLTPHSLLTPDIVPKITLEEGLVLAEQV